MTQAQLAQAARIPRPNLSNIERGGRDVTLRTLRALALALDVRPGVLADGELPHHASVPLTRAAMERIAKVANLGTETGTPRERTIARLLRRATAVRRAAAAGQRRVHPSAAGDSAYFQLKCLMPPATLASLLDRVARAAR